MVSLVASPASAALSASINHVLPFGAPIIALVNAPMSYLLIALLFEAIYKVLQTGIWNGATSGSGLSTQPGCSRLAKSLIGWHIGSSAVGSSFRAASALIIILLWVYYSSLIFLLGAELPEPIR
ncbi:hypothetical protein [Mesorhizobium sp. AR02]|uniref:hypothetical protein n=1 Tax=Mesorhizobium sp. AR02 TaxID=2865837 RepID=UPI00215EC0ED|nr:hypothetical protein [Mesorhizobium sp. AR02]